MTDTVFPGFLDAHVHLALIDPGLLASGGIARVLDLGGPGPVGSAPAPKRASIPKQTDAVAAPSATYAGQFLTAPGGYPGRQAWTPPGSVCEVASVEAAAAAVDRQVAGEASVIKVTLNSEAGPVLSADVLAAIVRAAHERRVPVVAHAQGVGQAAAAFAAEVDALAHTPFSERLADDLIQAMAARMTWISTLDIHGWGRPNADFARATDNLRRFHVRGGQVLYGTDLGNGPLPTGLNRRELEALLDCGLTPDDLLDSLTATRLGAYPNALPGHSGEGGLRTLVPGERPFDPADFARWLCTARAVGPGRTSGPRHAALPRPTIAPTIE